MQPPTEPLFFNTRPIKKSWFEAALQVLYPPRCLLCTALLSKLTAAPLCPDCLPGFAAAGFICPQCELFHNGNKKCFCSSPLPVSGLFALSWYEGEWRRMLHRLKYEGRRQLARPLGMWLGTVLLQQSCWKLDLIVPIPLHHRREKERGFNQTLLIARHAARALQLPLSPLLIKTRHTPSQTGLSRRERRQNVIGVFQCTGPEMRGKTALLVDDIYSTGATIREAASVLLQHGLNVYCAVTAYNRILTS